MNWFPPRHSLATGKEQGKSKKRGFTPSFQINFVQRYNSFEEAEKKGDLDTAVAKFGAAIEADSNSVEAYLARAAVYEKTAVFGKAAGDIAHVTDLEPMRADYQATFPRLLGREDSWYVAAQNFEAAAKLTPEDKAIARAESDFRQAVKRDPHNPYARAHLQNLAPNAAAR